jgi:hypothetical protein
VAATDTGCPTPGRESRARRALALLQHSRTRFPGLVVAHVAALLGGALAAGSVHAVVLPEDHADAMYHVYKGGGLTASGPALLVRKKLGDQLSLSGAYYVDKVSNASIDVVSTASPYKETRNEYTLGADYLVRDSLVSVSMSNSKEPDYVAKNVNVDVSQDVFGGMTTLSLGFSRGDDDVGRSDIGMFDTARHWRYRLGITQILSPTWLASANFEAIADDGYLGNPYRVAVVFGAYERERNPRTRSSRALKLRTVGSVTPGSAVHADYRYFSDNWRIRAHTVELGYSRYFGDKWLADWNLRYNTQTKASFYSDNASAETLYVSRNRQLSTYKSYGLGAKVAYTAARVSGKYEVKLNAAAERIQFKYSDFTDIRTGEAYKYGANVLQLFVSATF